MNNETHNTISDSILSKITREEITPKSAWFFKLKNLSIWILAGFTNFIGALAISSIMFRIVNIPRLTPPILPSKVGFYITVLRALPFIWLILFVLCSYLLYKEITYTRKGYKYQFWFVTLISLLVSTMLGSVLYVSGSVYHIDSFVSDTVYIQPRIENLQRQNWFFPSEGFLIGRVTEISGDTFTVTDPKNVVWVVSLLESVPEHERAHVELHEFVGLRGEEIASSTFVACAIDDLHMFGKRRQKPLIPTPAILHTVNERKISPLRINLCGGRTTP